MLGALLAFGNVKAILAKLDALLHRLDGAPGRIARTSTREELTARLRGWRHRTFGGDDVAALLFAAGELLRSTTAALPLPARGGLGDDLLRDVDGVVAVGGGYLVADSVVRSGGVALNHLPQILAAGRRDVPSVFLPQSIGPLLGPVGLATRRALSRIDVVYARDDITFRELQGVTDVRRCPDLAVLQLAHRLSSIRRPQGGSAGDTIVVPRELPRATGYHERLLSLGRALPSPRSSATL
jgi:hypothetical protein